MTLLFDLCATQPTKNAAFHGGSEYTKTVFLALVERAKHEKSITLYCFCFYDRPLDFYISDVITKNNIKLIKIKTLDEIYKICQEYNIDKLYSGLPYDYHNINLPPNIIFVATVHGIRGIEVADDKYMTRYDISKKERIKHFLYPFLKNYFTKRTKDVYSDLLKKKNIIITTDSNHSKFSIINTFNVDEKNIKVFYCPETVMPIVSEADSLEFLSKNKLEEHTYFLLVSCNRWEKNAYRSIVAFDKIISAHGYTQLKVVLVGCGGKLLKGIKNKHNFVTFEYLDRKDLVSLYKYAYCFVFPSLTEGFGYPPEEASRFGIPTISSADSSICEIYENSVLYFNPYDINEIQIRILEMLNDRIYKEYTERAINHYTSLCQKQRNDLKKLIDYLIEN